MPAALIASCGLGDEVDLRLEGRSIVIEALEKPRSSWFEGYLGEKDPGAWDALPPDDGIDEWEW